MFGVPASVFCGLYTDSSLLRCLFCHSLRPFNTVIHNTVSPHTCGGELHYFKQISVRKPLSGRLVSYHKISYEFPRARLGDKNKLQKCN